MEFISILNDVLGPVMRGPSSSHTAGSYHIGRLARSLLGEEPDSAIFTFDPGGSYAKTYKEQAADLAFAAGIMVYISLDELLPTAHSYGKEHLVIIGVIGGMIVMALSIFLIS